MAKKMFWEDVAQASERLVGTYILYGNQVYYVGSVDIKDRVPSARLTDMATGGTTWKDLADEGFHDFHKLPPLGYVNLVNTGYPQAALLTRIPERSRLHGLRANRIAVAFVSGASVGPAPINYENIVVDKGYQLSIDKQFPSAKQILENIDERQSAAFSPSYAISKDEFGVFRLWRRNLLVAIINEENVSFSKTTDCYREELDQTETFDIPVLN
jgi:hypothetical protein